MRLKLYRGKWAVVWTDESGRVRRKSLGTADRAAAERRFRDARVETPGDTVGDAIKAYLAEKRIQNARSFKSMETAWRALAGVFGNLRPDQIGRDVSRCYAETRRRAGISDGTIIKDLGVLKAALRWAGKSDFKIEMPATPPPRERYITREEHQRLLDACEFPHLRLFVLLAWSTAARASAIFDLTWDRVDFERGHIRLAKGEGRRKGRATVPMTDRLREALETAYAGRTCDSVLEWGGRPIKSVKRGFAEACRKAGLKNVTPHDLRRSAAVAMAEDGVPIPVIAQVLGHSNPAITYRVYSRFSPGFLKSAIKALE